MYITELEKRAVEKKKGMEDEVERGQTSYLCRYL